MSGVKRRFKRMQKGNVKSPEASCFCENGLLNVIVFYDGELGVVSLPGVVISDDDLRLMDEEITEAFKRLPWRDMDDLLSIMDFMVYKGLYPSEKTVKKD